EGGVFHPQGAEEPPLEELLKRFPRDHFCDPPAGVDARLAVNPFRARSECDWLGDVEGVTAASVVHARAWSGVISPMPEVCVSRWRIVTRAGLPSAVFSPLNSAKYFSTGSSTERRPSSWSMSSRAARIGLLIDAIQKMASVSIASTGLRAAWP